MLPLHPRARFWIEFGGLCTDLAAESMRAARRRLRPQPLRPGAFKTRRPGPQTPLWNGCRELLRHELRHYGDKVRLARYLGIPKQRVTDFLRGHRRMPDAETLLQMLQWIAGKQKGHDESL